MDSVWVVLRLGDERPHDDPPVVFSTVELAKAWVKRAEDKRWEGYDCFVVVECRVFDRVVDVLEAKGGVYYR